MIDFIKIYVEDIDLKSLQDNEFLDFYVPLSQKTGELLENQKEAKYSGLKFRIVNENKLIISGSLHKYHNNGIHNANDFGYENLLTVIIDLWNTFNINPYSAILQGIEYGVNINTTVSPKNIIKHSVINYKGDQPSINTFRGKGYMKEFEKQQYYIKVYDKGLQYHILKDALVYKSDNILRFEQKVIKMEYLKDTGLFCLVDLLKIDTLNKLRNKLLDAFDNLLIYDFTVKPEGLTAKQKNLLQNGQNAMFWVSLKKENRKKYYKELRKFKELAKEIGALNLHSELRQKIDEKLTNLQRINNENRDKLTDFLSKIKNENRDKLTDFVPNDKKQEKRQINPLYIELNCTENKKVCKVTGLNISMQKETSKFLCTSGLKFYKEHNPEKYSELEKRLSDKWRDATEIKRLEEIAHSIRNEYFNKIHNTKKRIDKLNEYPSIFDNFALIDKQYLKVAKII